jgi:hypothetical protein
MPVVPLLAGLVAVLVIAPVWLVAAGRRATASVPDDATVADLRTRLDALRERYAEIAAAVTALSAETGPPSTEAYAHEPGPRAPETLPRASPDAANVSTTAPMTVRGFPSPTAPSMPAQPPAASA